MPKLVIKIGGQKEIRRIYILGLPEKFSIATHTATLKKIYSVPVC